LRHVCVDNSKTDILIVGGGLVGIHLLLALENTKFNCLLIEATAPSSSTQSGQTISDSRTLVLSSASRAILETLRIWSLLEKSVTPIKNIHISEQHQFASAYLKMDTTPLGYVISMQPFLNMLQSRLNQNHILAPAELIAIDKTSMTATIRYKHKIIEIKTNLIVGADGVQSSVRKLLQLPIIKKDYKTHALVANIGLHRAHNYCAYERFTKRGPIALLPLPNQAAALIWTLQPKQAEVLQEADDTRFLKILQEDFGYRLGRFISVGKRQYFPLHQSILLKQTTGLIVCIGNAAHHLHPIAAQGFNLGLRDVAMLAQCIHQYGLTEAMLAEYVARRKPDQAIITHFTDILVKLFQIRLPGLPLLRNIGLAMLDNSDFLQNILKRYAGGFGGFVPNLVCGMGFDDRL